MASGHEDDMIKSELSTEKYLRDLRKIDPSIYAGDETDGGFSATGNSGVIKRDRNESSQPPILDAIVQINPDVLFPHTVVGGPIRIMDTRMPDTRIKAPDFVCGSLDEFEERNARLLKQSKDKKLMEVAADIVRRVSPLDTRVRTGQENSYTLARNPERIYDDFKGEYYNYGFKDIYVQIPAPDFIATGNVEGVAALGSALTYLLGRPAGPEEF